MDSIVKVIGVRAYLVGYDNYRSGYYLKLIDMSFNIIDSLNYRNTFKSWGSNNSYADFYFTDTTNIQNFYLTITFPYNDIINIVSFNFSVSSIDSNNYIYGCNMGHEPWISLLIYFPTQQRNIHSQNQNPSRKNNKEIRC